jgi:hypothetical protein
MITDEPTKGVSCLKIRNCMATEANPSRKRKILAAL